MIYDFYELYNILNFITMETSIILCAIALLVYYSTIFFLIRWLIDSKKRDPKKVFVFKLLSVLLAFIAGWAVVFFAQVMINDYDICSKVEVEILAIYI